MTGGTLKAVECMVFVSDSIRGRVDRCRNHRNYSLCDCIYTYIATNVCTCDF